MEYRESDCPLEAWNGIAKNKLELDQEDYVCGSARCLAGHAICLELHALGVDTSKVNNTKHLYDLIKTYLIKGDMAVGCIDYCEDRYSLPVLVSTALFCSYVELEDQWSIMHSMYGDKGLAPL